MFVYCISTQNESANESKIFFIYNYKIIILDVIIHINHLTEIVQQYSYKYIILTSRS